MKIFVTGVCGQLGFDTVNELKNRGYEVIGTDICEEANILATYVKLDITDKLAVEKVLNEYKPDAVIHCAAWTAVDAAEEPENYDKVMAVNVSGTENLAMACKALNIKMMYISTDYIFDGLGNVPWEPDCKEYKPLNIYGESKLQGELAVSGNLDKYFIVRIAWVFGKNGNNFIKTMLNVGNKYNELKVVNDQIGTPTYTYDLSRLLVDMIVSDKYGYYHATNEGGYISWYDFAKEIFRQATLQGKGDYSEERLTVKAVSTEEYGVSKAARPQNSRLDKQKLTDNGFESLPTWQDALKRYIAEIDV